MHKLKLWVRKYPVKATLIAIAVLVISSMIGSSLRGDAPTLLEKYASHSTSVGAPGTMALFMGDGMDEEMMMGASEDMAYSTKSVRSMPMPPMEPTAGETAAEVEQRIIKTGTMRIEVESVDDAIADFTGYATRQQLPSSVPVLMESE